MWRAVLASRRPVASGVSIVLVALLAGSGDVRATTPNTALRSPYSGTWTSGVSGGFTGSGKRSVTQPESTFNLTTGVAIFSQRSSASDQGCTTRPACSTADASSFIRFVSNSSIPSKGNHTVTTQ